MAQFLRAIFNSLPIHQFKNEEEIENFTLLLESQSSLNINYLISLTSMEELVETLKKVNGMNLQNKQLLADILTEMYIKTKPLKITQTTLYKEKALWLYTHINNQTKTFNWDIHLKLQILNQ